MVAVYFIAWRPWIEPGQPIIHPRIVTLCYIGIRVFASALNVGLFAWFTLMLRRTLATPPPSASDSPSVANSLAFQPGLATTA